MTTGPDDGDAPELPWDNPETMQSVLAELERIIGNPDSPYRFNWLLPVMDSDRLLGLLRSAPSGIGVSCLETYLRDRVGTQPGHVRIDDVE